MTLQTRTLLVDARDDVPADYLETIARRALEAVGIYLIEWHDERLIGDED